VNRATFFLSSLLALGVAASASAGGFKLTSADIAAGGTIKDEQVFNGFGCSGKNVSPALAWSGAPDGTKGYALLVHDPDAPTGGAGWWHWLAVNLPATTQGLAADAGKADGSGLPAGTIQIKTDFGGPGWGGPCPPPGDKPHHYNFTLYALKVDKLELPPDASPALVGYMVNANSLGKATLTGRYGRPK
jgi:Raf kinase inhibitor-like YbhB/YbcL family protein